MLPRRLRRRRRPRATRRPLLTIEQILAWADDHQSHTGRWPRPTGRHVRADPNEKWRNIDQVLRQGGRGLEGGSSLPQLLAHYRGVRNHQDLPELSEGEILEGADAHRKRAGHFPRAKANLGPLPDAPAEKWPNID